MAIITIDFETYFDQDYTLAKLNTSQYIRHPKFYAHGMGIHVDDQPSPQWVPHHLIRQKLGTYHWGSSSLICHNTAFDGLILSHHYNIHPARLVDTLSMARGWYGVTESASLDAIAKRMNLGYKVSGVLEKTKGLRMLPGDLLADLAAYCIQDVALTRKIYDQFIAAHFPKEELDIIHHTIKAFTEPKLQVSEAVIQAEIERLQSEKNKLLINAAAILSDTPEATRAKISSNPQFANVLLSLGVTPPIKISPSTGKETFAFAKQDLNFQELLKHPNPDVVKICKARLNIKSTIGETRAKRLLSNASPALPVLMNYCGAHTMRFSAANKLNLQNLPRINPKDPTSGQLRKAIHAPAGHKLVIADSSQIEDRMNCYVSGQQDILDIYRAGGDPYKRQAQEIFGLTEEEITPHHRFLGKVARLALGYGCGVDKFAHIVRAGLMGPPLDITDDEAKDVVQKYRDSNTKIKDFWGRCTSLLQTMTNKQGHAAFVLPECGIPIFEIRPGCAHMPNGLKLHYNDIEQDKVYQITYTKRNNVSAKVYGGLFAENIVQCLARIAVIHQIIQVANFAAYAQLVLLVHDEGVFSVPEDKAETFLDLLLTSMRTPLPWCLDLPFNAEGIISDYYDKP